MNQKSPKTRPRRWPNRPCECPACCNIRTQIQARHSVPTLKESYDDRNQIPQQSDQGRSER